MDYFTAGITQFGGTFAPRDWVFCYGQLEQISNNGALYALLGTNFGGDGRVTMGIPDLRGRTTIGPGTGPGLTPYNVGSMYGFETITLTESQLPSHTHNNTVTAAASPVSIAVDIAASSSNGIRDKANSGDVIGVVTDTKGDTKLYTDATADIPLASVNATGSVTPNVAINNARTGSGDRIENRQPFTAIHSIMCTNGIFPSRN